MHTERIRSGRFEDPVHLSRKHRLSRRRIVLLLSATVLLALAAWGIFFSGAFAVTDITVTGVSSVLTSQIREMAKGRNLLFVDVAALRNEVTEKFASIGEVTVTKKYRHGLVVAVSERQPAGIWCSLPAGQAGGDTCRFWDRSGKMWGSVLPSEGPLLLLVRDENADESGDTVSPRLLSGLLTALDGLPKLSLRVRRITLPQAVPGSATITTTAGYDIYIDALGDVADQVSTLGVFLGDRAKDSNFKPQYIDLRTPGRVYYR